MTTWFVTRHTGAVDWAREEGILNEAEAAKVVSSIDPANEVRVGDVVIGTLPVHLAAEICSRGGRYLQLAMQVPDSHRGKELSVQDMRSFGASLQEFVVMGQKQDRPAHNDISGTNVHVCLVSDQHFANLLPILKRRPVFVELVCTPEMRGAQLDRIVRSLVRFGYGGDKVTPYFVDSGCSTDLAIARGAARLLREDLLRRYPGVSITLNATGGTKALSTAFFLEFQGFEIMYTDTWSNNIRFLDDQSREPEPLGAQLKNLDDYFHCQGFRVVRSGSRDTAWCNQAKARQATTNEIVRQSQHYVIGQLNSAAQRLEKLAFGSQPARNFTEAKRIEMLEQAIPSFQIPKIKLNNLTEVLVHGGTLVLQPNGNFRFSNYGAMRYLTGGWLEEWVWLVATTCGAEVVEANVGLRAFTESDIENASNQEDNELDLVVLHKNRLLIAECKTIHWQGVNGKQEIFNKLDALGTHARGLFGKSMLISAKELDPMAKRRAQAYGITVIQSNGLSDIKDQIQRWINA